MSELEKILNIEADSNLKHFKKGEFIQQPNQLKANAVCRQIKVDFFRYKLSEC